MGECFLNQSGGGGSLNFKVKDYATEELLMAATGKVNEIGIITSTPMTGWYMAVEQPEGMQPGEVWISTDTKSLVAFNVLKKNCLMVYPLSAKQMGNDGALVDVTAKSWQDGKWVDWVTYLLDGADKCENITGGWNTRCHTNNSYSLGTATFGNNGVTLKAENGKAVCVSTNNKINLSGKSSFYIVVSNATITNQSDFALYLSASPLASVNSNGNQAAKLIIRQGENTIEIPDGLSGGEYYVNIGMHVYNQGTQTATIEQVTLK